MKNQLLPVWSLAFFLLACTSEPEEIPQTPLSDRNLEFEIYDSLVVDYLGNLILMDISPDGESFLLIDQNTDSIFVTNPEGNILNKYKLAGDGPENYTESRSGLAKFISPEEYLLPTSTAIYRYNLDGKLGEKYELGFSPNIMLIVSNGDNLGLRENKVYTTMSGRAMEEGKMGIEYQKVANVLEILDLETGEYTPTTPFPRMSRFSSETESHTSLAYYANVAVNGDSVFISFRNEPTIYSYHYTQLDSPARVMDVPFGNFILSEPAEDEDQSGFRMRDLFVGTINSVIPIGDGQYMIDYLSGLKDEEINPILSEMSGDFSKIFEEANKINTAGRVIFDGKSISPIIHKPKLLGSLTKFVSQEEIWFALNFSEAENDYSVIYKTRLIEK
ncbi:hypothetical protein ACFOSV_08575 [Algoriphagus namhaensis]|uniref:DUF4221 domain-containing protein n=1 Tax=Algoriphagus namhaensis TaxID=915353 RepID=A0ABV8AQH7_9BACT